MDFAELNARLDALEDRRITVADLPIAKLQDKLEVDWLPNPGLLLPALGKRRIGSVVLTWAAGAAASNVATVYHDLGTTPSKVLATMNETGGPDLAFVQAFTLGATSFQLCAGFRAGTWGAGGTLRCAWEAIG